MQCWSGTCSATPNPTTLTLLSNLTSIGQQDTVFLTATATDGVTTPVGVVQFTAKHDFARRDPAGGFAGISHRDTFRTGRSVAFGHNHGDGDLQRQFLIGSGCFDCHSQCPRGGIDLERQALNSVERSDRCRVVPATIFAGNDSVGFRPRHLAPSGSVVSAASLSSARDNGPASPQP